MAQDLAKSSYNSSVDAAALRSNVSVGVLSDDDEAFQLESLAGVSRTFALTIPQLPPGLRRAVANGYLLCRIADTIEDDPALGRDEKGMFLEALLAELEERRDGQRLADALSARLSNVSLPTERRLIQEMPRVLRITGSLDEPQRRSLIRCAAIMGRGMAEFGQRSSRAGLESLESLERYCYHVAGVVGEMLTDLFCHHSPRIARRRPKLAALAVSFGQGLQMTNILKDIWADLERGVCWLPRQVFAECGYDLSSLPAGHDGPEFAEGLRRLVAVAHGNLRDALHFTLTIPRSEAGIRRFLMWAVGLAVLTLGNISANPGFSHGAEVKVPRSTVRRVIAMTNACIRSNMALGVLFRRWARGLPEPLSCGSRLAGLSPDGWAARG
ncbi:MAG: phytoene/squalene synthase family protein [Acidobacteria bacterium]|nr:phytoene/squalene synthase family protein [Acidobacteriota bacterium]